MSKFKNKFFLIVLILFLPLVYWGFNLTIYTNFYPSFYELNENENFKQLSIAVAHDPIIITSNSEFAAVSSGGNGQAGNPYIIENFEITTNNEEPFLGISITGTTAYFKIRNCLINNYDKTMEGIYLDNVDNGVIENNIIFNSRHGIYVKNTGNTIIRGNNIYNTAQSGIRIGDYGGSIDIIDNELSNNTYNSIWLEGLSQGVIVDSNIIHENTENGIFIDGRFQTSREHTIINNIISKMENGILLYTPSVSGSTYVEQNLLEDNIIFENTESGIALFGANTESNELYFNIIRDNREGIVFAENSHHNIAINNTIIENQKYGVFLNSSYNVLNWNSFVGNLNFGTSQAKDDGAFNDIISNYYDEWTTPDNDLDGYVDFPYSIDGAAGNSDPLPLASPMNPIDYHFLSQIILISPTGGEVVNDVTTIMWNQCFDSMGFDVYYYVYKSSDGGTNWVELATGLRNIQYEWNTVNEPKGTNYRIKVTANSTGGLGNVDISDLFTLQEHALSEPTIIYPLGGEVLSGQVNISWQESIDNWGKIVNYSVHYSSDGGNNWVDVVTGLTNTKYEWDTSALIEGSDYKLKVVAHSLYYLDSEDISETFSIIPVSGKQQVYEPLTLGLVIGGVCGGVAVAAVVVIVLRRRRVSRE
ncbi:MAG: right-handed parallel beta-helix repeat-containing protein [Candidatus Thorarchaeota archaeon]